jgi:hypothetical protein
MKFLFSVIIILACQISYSQKVPAKKGDIQIEIISHYLKRNKDFDLTKKISNRANRPDAVYYLDKNGVLLEKIGYGKHHNNSLKLMDYIEVYEYDTENGNLKSMVKWESDYQKNIYPYWKTKYLYNTKNNLTKELTYYAENDSLFMTVGYEYDHNNNLAKTILSPTHYRENVYDTKNQKIQYRSFFENKLYWEYNFTYTDSTCLGIFQTHYADGKNYTREEIREYKGGKIIELEEKADSNGGLDCKAVYYYNNQGLIEKTEYYTRYKASESYGLESYVVYKYKGINNPNKELVQKINTGVFNL